MNQKDVQEAVALAIIVLVVVFVISFLIYVTPDYIAGPLFIASTMAVSAGALYLLAKHEGRT